MANAFGTPDEAIAQVRMLVSPAYGQEKAAKTYDEMSGAYDTMTSNVNFTGPKVAADQVAAILKDNHNAKILDVGAGTGLAGTELKKLGYTNMVAVDASSGLLEVAKGKDIYKQTVCQFVGCGDPMPFEDGSFDLVVLSGAMGENHLPLAALDDIIRVTRPGGHIVNVFREEAVRTPMYQDKFEPYLSNLEKEGKWKQMARTNFPCFLQGVPGLILIHQVL